MRFEAESPRMTAPLNQIKAQLAALEREWDLFLQQQNGSVIHVRLEEANCPAGFLKRVARERSPSSEARKNERTGEPAGARAEFALERKGIQRIRRKRTRRYESDWRGRNRYLAIAAYRELS